MLFSIPKHFPGRVDLAKFGYCLDNGLKLNLSTSVNKERNVNILLSSVLKKSGKVISTKRNKVNNGGRPTLRKKLKKSCSSNFID